MKKIIIGLIAANLLTNACTYQKYGKAIWEGRQVYTIENTLDSSKIKPDYINYAVKINDSKDSLVNINSDNLYVHDNERGVWKKAEENFSKLEELESILNKGGNLLPIPGIGIRAVMRNDTLYTITRDNIRIGFDGIGGFYPRQKK
jgi:hypothetical protein